MDGKKSFVPESVEDKKKKLLAKHPPKTEEDIAETMKRKAEAQKKYTDDVDELEANLKTFSERAEAVVDPVTDKAIFKVRNPSQQEMEDMIPVELKPYQSNPNKIPPALQVKYKDHLFIMMEKLIVKPVHTAKEWKAIANLPIQVLFNRHLEKVYEELGINVANFQEQTEEEQ